MNTKKIGPIVLGIAPFNGELIMKITKSLAIACAPVTILFCLASPANAALVGHWTFDNAANVGQANVSSDLEASNVGASYTADGKSGGALSLDGNSSYLRVNASQTLAAGMPTGDSSFTVAAFIRTSIGFNGRGGIIGWGNYGGVGQVNAFRTAGGGALAHYSWGGAYDLDPVATPGIFNNMWHHVAATYDSATSTKRIYFDGRERGSKSVPNLSVQGMNFTVAKTVGSEYFNGSLDDVRVYSTALSSTEIIALAGDLYIDDTDGDGVGDGNDNCPDDANHLQDNNDGDALGDICDSDDDNDGTDDIVDNCPIDGNPDQADFDFDDLGDACDTSIDSGSIAQHVEDEVADVVQLITSINISGGNGMVSKLTGNGGVIKKIASAITAFEGGMIDLETYLSELDGALSKLSAFDNQVAAKIGNGKIVEPDATWIPDASAEIRATIDNLKVAAGG
jgi:hypothetical protein